MYRDIVILDCLGKMTTRKTLQVQWADFSEYFYLSLVESMDVGLMHTKGQLYIVLVSLRIDGLYTRHDQW
jgi:hypothetical protein